jgi:hypothetical protein
MTMLTHYRTRMEIRDCCDFWAVSDGSGLQLSIFGQTGQTGHRKAADCGHFAVRFGNERRLTSAWPMAVTGDSGDSSRCADSPHPNPPPQGGRENLGLRSGCFVETFGRGRWQGQKTLPQRRPPPSAGPKNLGEAAARRRVTKPTYVRTRTEIRDCCVFWAIFGGSDLRSATLGQTGQTGHRKAANCGHFAVRYRSEQRLTSGWPNAATVYSDNGSQGRVEPNGCHRKGRPRLRVEPVRNRSLHEPRTRARGACAYASGLFQKRRC